MADPNPPAPEIANGDTAQLINSANPEDTNITTGLASNSVDVEMKDSADISAIAATNTIADATSTTHLTAQLPSAPTPLPTTAPTVAGSTPTRNSPHPASSMPPAHAIPHGSPTRMYLNQNVTPHLLEAMKHLVTNEPDKPLKWLSEFLAQKSLEIEGP